jgi:hypothetical protein
MALWKVEMAADGVNADFSAQVRKNPADGRN